MPDAFADILIACFSAGSSLRSWSASGRLTRELPFLGKLGASYRKVLLLTHGTATDFDFAGQVRLELGPEAQVIPVKNDGPIYENAIPLAKRIARHLTPTDRIVIQTNQFDDGGLSQCLLSPLRGMTAQVALVSRARYLESRLYAGERGPHDARAIAAGLIEERVADTAQIIVGTTQQMADDFAWRYGVSPARMRVIPNFVQTDRAPTPAYEREQNRLVVAGDLVTRRRVDHAIKGVAGLPPEMRKNFVLQVIGDGPERDRLKDLAKELGVNARFEGVMEHNELLDQLHTCTCYLHPSIHEVTSRILLCAMASGTPVMVAHTPGINDIIDNGVNGIVVPGSPESFAYALSGLLPDEDWRNMLGASAAQQIRARCSIEHVVEQTLRAHKDAIEGLARSLIAG